MAEALNKRIMASMIIVGIVLGFVVIETSTHLVLNEVEGTPILNTVFNHLEPGEKMPIFDMTGMESKNSSYFIDSNLWNLPLISSMEAREVAYKFLETNFAENQLESISIEWQDLVGDQPTWVLSITGPYIKTLVFVNAISGEVIGWNLSSLSLDSPEPYYENRSFISEGIAEDRAIDFLTLNNYSLPDNARYLGVKEYLSDLNNYYLIFRHYEGQFPVGVYPLDSNINPDHSFEGIILRIDKITGAITQFGYRWRNITPPPTLGILSEWDAETIARAFYESSNVSIIHSGILISSVPGIESTDGSPRIHLVWCFALNKESRLVYVFIDAYTGEVLDEQRTNSVAPDIIYEHESPVPIFVVSVSFTIAIIVAASARFMARKKYLFDPIEQ